MSDVLKNMHFNTIATCLFKKTSVEGLEAALVSAYHRGAEAGKEIRQKKVLKFVRAIARIEVFWGAQ